MNNESVVQKVDTPGQGREVTAVMPVQVCPDSAGSNPAALALRGWHILQIDCGACGRPVWECACDFGV